MEQVAADVVQSARAEGFYAVLLLVVLTGCGYLVKYVLDRHKEQGKEQDVRNKERDAWMATLVKETQERCDDREEILQQLLKDLAPTVTFLNEIRDDFKEVRFEVRDAVTRFERGNC